jgi:hypothetical protein
MIILVKILFKKEVIQNNNNDDDERGIKSTIYTSKANNIEAFGEMNVTIYYNN